MSAPILTLLVAEDDEDDQLLLEEAVNTFEGRLRIAFADDGVSLLEQLRAWDEPRPPLVILDLNMPRMNGWDVLEAIRADPALQLTVRLVMSTSNAPEDVARAYALGAHTFFTKPMRFEDLRQALNTIVSYWHELALWPRDREPGASSH